MYMFTKVADMFLPLQALKILNDDMQCDIIKIGGLIRNKVLQEADGSKLLMQL